ncbi:Sag1p NDAI_0C02370 [Naumovozyma dairenensis CBS 421]|uniref:Agglutinin-like protein N-terminal domain-containing protein n=1 Tax=Naumovozyma dairenensis (strain ATCC 10597 / BCRC 20456 / CBS 421 / NBRC 0211 / NRRL Y-12639) TaxID=1071378 RepID=G0W7Y6_NAUDC|nr:hypothetical protein NDAI_0C02370 [Naumovozyma dairenensis CBS 421]CCD23897.1 hypothetical protein NDAI_0C02370 [Naumovozyma dairenensis CBS 421]
MLQSAILLWLSILTLTSSKEISNIQYSNLEYSALSSVHYPNEGWDAKFDFSIPDSSSIIKGDEFSISMPYVYRIKFSDNSKYYDVSLNDGTKAFQCTALQQASYDKEASILTCTASTDLSSYSSISGSIDIGLSFSSGDSAYQYELANAAYFKSGTMDVPLMNDLSAPITFDAASFPLGSYSMARSTTKDSLENYYLAMKCPNGYLLGGTENINFDTNGSGHDVDCSSVQVYKSSKFNDWFFPEDYEDASADVVCYGSNLMITMGQASPGEMLWVNALQSLEEGVNTIDQYIELTYSCSDTVASTIYTTEYSATTEYIIVDGYNSASALASSKTNACHHHYHYYWLDWFFYYYLLYRYYIHYWYRQYFHSRGHHPCRNTKHQRCHHYYHYYWLDWFFYYYLLYRHYIHYWYRQYFHSRGHHPCRNTKHQRCHHYYHYYWLDWSFTTTYSTDTTFTIGTGSISTPEVIIHVETPSPTTVFPNTIITKTYSNTTTSILTSCSGGCTETGNTASFPSTNTVQSLSLSSTTSSNTPPLKETTVVTTVSNITPTESSPSSSPFNETTTITSVPVASNSKVTTSSPSSMYMYSSTMSTPTSKPLQPFSLEVSTPLTISAFEGLASSLQSSSLLTMFVTFISFFLL